MDYPRAYWDPIHAVLSPPKKLMRSLTMPWKLAIVMGLFSIPMSYLMYSYWTRATVELDAARLEVAGATIAPVILDLQVAVNQGGDAVNATTTAMEKALERSGDELKARPALEEFRKAWTAAASLSGPARAKASAAAGAKMEDLWEHVIDASGIVLDPEIDTYHLMLGFSQSLPSVGNHFNALAVLARKAKGGLSAAERLEAAGHVAVIRKELEIVRMARGDIEKANPAVGALVAPTKAWIANSESLGDEAWAALADDKDGGAGFARLEPKLAPADAGSYAEAKRWAHAFDGALLERAGRLNRMRWFTFVLAAVTAGLSVYLLLGFWMAIRGGIIAMQRSLERIGAGDLASAADVEGQDEISLALHAIHDMQKSLAGTMGQVRSVSDSLGTAGGEIASGNQDLASRTEEQAASLQQTAASIHHLDEAVQRNVGNAQKASVLVAQASQVANRGGTAVQGVVETMGAIQSSSKKISEIIGVIDGIAFQTNILALNAAVEAARAGEQGRGFAVVASEVRTLAQRSATAAKEIKGLIEASVQDVDRGARQVRDTTGTIAEVVTAVERAAQLMERIALDSREQGEGIAEVTKAVGQMDAVTQQNSALVEQTAAASESLKSQAHELVAVVARFRLQGTGLSPA